MDDLISRQAAIDCLKKHRTLYCNTTQDSFKRLQYPEKCRVDEIDNAIASLVNLPSIKTEVLACGEGVLGAKPKREVGWWISEYGFYNIASKCSVCKRKIYLTTQATYEFCPHCGAKMEGVYE